MYICDNAVDWVKVAEFASHGIGFLALGLVGYAFFKAVGGGFLR